MIALEKFRETQRLLALGNLSQRRIAAMVGISRATVGTIANGKYSDREVREHARARARARADEYVPSGLLERCPGCGGMVYLPCLLCRVSSMRKCEQRVLKAGRHKARRHALWQLLNAVRQAHLLHEAEEKALRRAG